MPMCKALEKQFTLGYAKAGMYCQREQHKGAFGGSNIDISLVAHMP